MGVVRPFKPQDAAHFNAVIGVDEVGRGALCGPVVAAAVWFDPLVFPPEIFAELDDSKRLTPRKREELTRYILRYSRTSVAASSTTVIDQVGILRATLMAMRRAILRLKIDAPILVDGRDVPPGVMLPVTPVIGGDRTIPQIAAASILAKTCRDRIMTLLSARHSGYCWEQNMGYGTAQHLAGIAAHGITAHHRKSFKPILQQSFSLDGLSTAYIDLVPDELDAASSGQH